jgi:hypothetical protein
VRRLGERPAIVAEIELVDGLAKSPARLSATSAQTASTIPNGQTPATNP